MNKKPNLKGYWLDDDFLSFIKGYGAFKSTYRDARKFSIELDRVGNNLFQIGNDEKYLTITYPNNTIQQDLNLYFIAEYGRYRDKLYGNHFHLGNLFNDLMQMLAMYGKDFCALDWEEKDIEGRKYWLPSAFRYLSVATMSVRKDQKGNVDGYIQRYSPFTKSYSYDPSEKLTRKFDFKKEEIFFVKYPLDDIHPVKKSMHLLKPILEFWDFGLDRSESWSGKPQRLKVAIASQQRYSEEKRKYALARAEVRRNFHYLLNIDDLTITEYYDIFLVRKYKKELNVVRNYFVEQFNQQIMVPFAAKNSLEVPQLVLSGFMTNDEIDSFFDRYVKREITSKMFIDGVVNKD
jgi:hypothetical protein